MASAELSGPLSRSHGVRGAANPGRAAVQVLVDRHARAALRHLTREFGDRPLSSITRVEAENWAAKVPNGAVAVAVTVMERAYEAEELDRNRFKGLSKRPEGRRNDDRRLDEIDAAFQTQIQTQAVEIVDGDPN